MRIVLAACKSFMLISNTLDDILYALKVKILDMIHEPLNKNDNLSENEADMIETLLSGMDSDIVNREFYANHLHVSSRVHYVLSKQHSKQIHDVREYAQEKILLDLDDKDSNMSKKTEQRQRYYKKSKPSFAVPSSTSANVKGETESKPFSMIY